MGEFMNKGFTLVELLVAMAISGVIMTGVFSAFKSQQDSYLAQEQVAEMQQNLRAGLYILTGEIRMAGYDAGGDTEDSSCNLGATGISVAPGILAVAANQLDFSMDLNSDGDCSDTDENLSYYIYTSTINGVTIDKLGRRDNTAATPTVQAVAESFEELEFTYLDSSSPPVATNILADIRSVQISILAKARNPDRNYTDSRTYPPTPAGTTWGAYGDNFRRRFQTMTVKCRNMGL